MSNPTDGFIQDELYSPGVVFSVKQSKYDKNYIITPISFARRIFDQQGMLSSLELRLKPNADIESVKAELQQTVGSKYKVRDRYEQQEDVFKIMKIEKFIAYIFLTFILMVACFNIIGSLSMLIIDKKDDVNTLRSLGATDKQIVHVFLFEGRMISTFGAVTGIVHLPQQARTLILATWCSCKHLHAVDFYDTGGCWGCCHLFTPKLGRVG
jgi:lipoprotein-releasing system permease protein